jgi:RNA polymerase sigma-70 factor (ECF subfamily)
VGAEDAAPLVDAEDAVVAAVFAAGGDDALRAAYDAYGPLVFTFCRRALGPDRAGDATQEVFLAAWRSRARFDPAQGTLRGWLVGIARYKVLAALRAGGRAAALTVDGAVVPEGRAADAVEVLADRMVLTDALDVLPERARRSVRLAYADGLSHREIADATGVPLGTVKSDIRRGLDVLRRELGGTGG